ncbi:DUF1822 family protein [Scytonema sp. NUACC26]|uniref:DUF1822 family protein n=1 Tax=Scytonema sp. NUACC26 TaxID=3140176 RepID=UPI0034DB8E3D
MFSFTELATADTKHLWLKISPAEQQIALQQSQYHSNPIACYNAYLNHVCLHCFNSWLEEWFQEEPAPQPKVWLDEDNLPSIWELVNGAAIELGDTRLVLVPTETMDLEEFSVPQEWVDISSWAADYYLAMLVNIDDEDDCWIGVYGFATHSQLKNEGKYNERHRTYSLPAQQLTENLTLLFATLGLHLREKIPLESSLAEVEAKNLLLTLGDVAIYSPRLQLDVPFSKWGALISNQQWRQQLYNRRLGFLHDTSPVTVVTKTRVNLSQWFQKLFVADWQPIDVLLGKQLDIIAFESRNSSASGTSVNGVKVIDLGMQLGGQSVALLLALTQDEEKIGILVQVYPTRNEKYLPPNLKLVLLESGKALQEARSRSRDYYIQLNRFKGLPGSSFSLQLILGNFNITEDFFL